jgi:hypothetical protein
MTKLLKIRRLFRMLYGNSSCVGRERRVKCQPGLIQTTQTFTGSRRPTLALGMFWPDCTCLSFPVLDRYVIMWTHCRSPTRQLLFRFGCGKSEWRKTYVTSSVSWTFVYYVTKAIVAVQGKNIIWKENGEDLKQPGKYQNVIVQY